MSHRPSSKSPSIIAQCESIIKSFNPVTHSIDTHVLDVLGDVTLPNSKPQSVLIQQIVYGCLKEKPMLKCFIDEFYGDNAARVLRVDMLLYTVLAYLVVFRLDELGMARFKKIALQEEPTKIMTFVSYVFDKENLWNTVRSAWMRVLDLDFVEKKILPRLEKFIPDMTKFLFELDAEAASLAVAAAMKEEAKAKGEAGLTKVEKKVSTVPVSPRLTQTRLPVLVDPERIPAQVLAKDVPDFINRTNLAKIAQEKKDMADKTREATQKKYPSSLLYKFHENKGGRSIEEVRREVDEEFNKQLAFDSSFYHEPPDFSKVKADVKLNASTVLKEDFLYRRQQAKDAALLRQYEEELRDPFDYYMWQHEMKERDHQDKLKQVVFRREQAKQTSIEAKDAMEKQKEDNSKIANLMREQAEVIKEQKVLEKEIEMLRNKELVHKISEVRDKNPIEAAQKVIKERIEIGKRVREELEEKRLLKEEEDRREEELKADRIRQLRAMNTVHKEHIAVFDPTLTSGVTLLDQMSHMEMKIRRQQEKMKAEEAETLKRQEIADEKKRKMDDLERRKDTIMRARELKAATGKSNRQKLLETKRREEEELEQARREADSLVKQEIARKHELKRQEQEALKAEEARIKRQQQYLGVAMGQVEQMRERELHMARERQAREQEKEAKLKTASKAATSMSDRKNKSHIEAVTQKSRLAEIAERDLAVEMEKKLAIEKFKTSVVEKKVLFREGQHQHDATKTALIEHNPYAHRISEESLTKVRTMQKMARSLSGGAGGGGGDSLRMGGGAQPSKRVQIQ